VGAPSAAAIRDGRRRYPKVGFYRGLSQRLPAAVRRSCYDLVILNFVLHWVDRADLLTAAAQADAVVKDGGYLIIGDFLPTFGRQFGLASFENVTELDKKC